MKKHKLYFVYLITVLLVFNLILASPIKNSVVNASNHDSRILDSSFTIIDEAFVGSSYLNEVIDYLITSGLNKFYIKNGNYTLNDTLILSTPDIVILGESNTNTIVRQLNPAAMGIRILANRISIQNIYLDNQIGKEAVAAYDADNVTIQNCTIYGSTSNSAIAFYGKNVPDENEAVRNNNLNQNNTIIDNIIYSNLVYDSKDGIFFSKQKNGVISNNIIDGSRIAFYLSNDSEITNNVVMNSESNGIRYAVPAYNNTIENNTIENTKASGIVVVRNDAGLTDNTYRASNLILRNNYISKTRYFGIEISNLKDSQIVNNTITESDFYGIYLLFADNLIVQKNTIKETNLCTINGALWSWNTADNSSIFLDYMVTNSFFSENTIENEADCPFGIKIQSGGTNVNNQVMNNIISGYYSYGISANEQMPENTLLSGNSIYLKDRRMPQNILTTVSGSSVHISWNPENDVKGYEVAVNGTIKDTNMSTYYEDFNLEVNTTYIYKVRIKGGNWSDEIMVVILPEPTTMPKPDDPEQPGEDITPSPVLPSTTITPTPTVAVISPQPTQPVATVTPTPTVAVISPQPTQPVATVTPTPTVAVISLQPTQPVATVTPTPTVAVISLQPTQPVATVTPT
ncbi:right-handed parallel beta-helix repeat-containing protein, partial [Anaerocolumna cellulosilytica]